MTSASAPLYPPSLMLMGAAGAGKTSSLVTLLALGIKVRMLATEPSAPNRVLQECKKRNISDAAFDWCVVSPAMSDWDSLIKSAEIVNTRSLKQIADISDGIAKQNGGAWITMLHNIKNFKSARTGLDLGDATEWGPDCAFVIDGLTGISDMSRQLTVGLKPNPSPGEWGVMQNNILGLVKKLASDCKCFFVLIAHIERENDEITGVRNITVGTLGAKLAPKLPPAFTSVVLAKRDGATFLWSVAERGVDTKAGDLDFKDNLPPDFKPIVEGFRARLAAISATEQKTVTPAVNQEQPPSAKSA